MTRSPSPGHDMYCDRNLKLLREKRQTFAKAKPVAKKMIVYACTLDRRFEVVNQVKFMGWIRVRIRKKVPAPAAATSATTVRAVSASAHQHLYLYWGRRGREKNAILARQIFKKGIGLVYMTGANTWFKQRRKQRRSARVVSFLLALVVARITTSFVGVAVGV